MGNDKALVPWETQLLVPDGTLLGRETSNKPPTPDFLLQETEVICSNHGRDRRPYHVRSGNMGFEPNRPIWIQIPSSPSAKCRDLGYEAHSLSHGPLIYRRGIR